MPPPSPPTPSLQVPLLLPIIDALNIREGDKIDTNMEIAEVAAGMPPPREAEEPIFPMRDEEI
jgi:hypothetical protein